VVLVFPGVVVSDLLAGRRHPGRHSAVALLGCVGGARRWGIAGRVGVDIAELLCVVAVLGGDIGDELGPSVVSGGGG